MRSKPRKSNKGKVAAVLIVLALIWLAAGTFGLMKFRNVILNGTYNGGSQSQEQQGEGDDIADQSEGDDVIPDDDDPDADFEDPDDDWDNDGDPDDDWDDNGGPDDDEDPDEDGEPDDADDFDDEDQDDAEPDDAETFTVDAWDGFAAVRTGRGVGYAQVGKIVNGNKVTVTDLKDGWYKIVGGEYDGYYLHKSSLR